jgi:hypothetical protein
LMLPTRTPLDEAKAAIRDLERQRDALNRKRVEHDSERERIAYAARVHHDRDAIDRLSEMKTEALGFD